MNRRRRWKAKRRRRERKLAKQVFVFRIINWQGFQFAQEREMEALGYPVGRLDNVYLS